MNPITSRTIRPPRVVRSESRHGAHTIASTAPMSIVNARVSVP